MVLTNGRKCLRFVMYGNSEDTASVHNFLKDFEKLEEDVIFHRPMMDKDGIFVTFTLRKGGDDLLVEFLWNLIRYFKDGTFPALKKVMFMIKEVEVFKLHPIDTVVS